MFLDVGFERLQEKNPQECKIIIDLNRFFKEKSTLPMSEEKPIIAVFRLAINLDNYVEELFKVKHEVKEVQLS